MKTRILLTCLAALLAGTAFSKDDGELTISESRIPNSPAFSLLGINPTAVEHPSSPMQLGASIAGAFGSDNSGKLGNIALEFSPYWWTKNSHQLSYDEYYNLSYKQVDGKWRYENKGLGEQSIVKNFYQTLTFSLATAQSDSMGNTNSPNNGNAVGFAFRSTLIKGQLPAKALENRLKIREIDKRISKAMVLGPDGQVNVPNSLYDELLDVEKDYASSLEYLAGFQLDVAGGATMDLQESSLRRTEFRRAGAWMNASYRSDESGGLLEQFALLANTRYFFTRTIGGEDVSSIDCGARISWISPSEKFPLTLAAEYVHRINSGAVEDVDRFGIIATLKISDRYAIYLSHGANIEKDVLSKDQNVTFVGLNVLLGKATARRDQ